MIELADEGVGRGHQVALDVILVFPRRRVVPGGCGGLVARGGAGTTTAGSRTLMVFLLLLQKGHGAAGHSQTVVCSGKGGGMRM